MADNTSQELRDQLDLTRQLSTAMATVVSQIQNAVNAMANLNTNAQNVNNQTQQAAGAANTLNKAENNLVKTLGKVEKQLQNQYKLEGSLKTELEARRDALLDQIQLQGISQDLYQDEIDAVNEILHAQNALARPSEAEIARQRKVVDLLGESGAQLDDFIDRYVPMGRTLSKFIGLNEVQLKLQEAHTAAQEAFNATLIATQGDTEAAGKAAREAFNKVIGPANFLRIGIMAGVAALSSLVNLAMSLEKQFTEIAKETGITVSQSRALVESSQEVAYQLDNQLISMKDVLAVQQATIKEFGTMLMITPEIAAEVANIGEAFGYGAAEAAKVNNALLGLGVSAEDAATAQRQLAADALKAGVNVATVTADIATNSKAVAKFFGGNVKALKDSAIEAAKLGLSLADMAKVSESLLDIETSLANQYEFMALTGQELYLDRARALAAEGDIAGATKEIISQMGTIDEFNKMDVFQKEAAAKAAGLSVDELQKSLVLQEKLGAGNELAAAAAAELNMSASELNKLSAEQIESKVAESRQSKKLLSDISDIGNQIKLSLLPAGQAFLDIISAISPVFKVISGIVGLIAGGLDVVLNKLGPISAALKVLIGLAAAFAVFNIGASIYRAIGGIPFVGPALATAAVLAAVGGISKLAQSAGDMFSPADGRTQISTKEGGLFQLSKNDDVIAAPGLASAMSGGGTTSTGGSTDMSTTNALLNQLVSNISALSNRPVQIVIGGRVVDEIKAQADINSTYVVGAG